MPRRRMRMMSQGMLGKGPAGARGAEVWNEVAPLLEEVWASGERRSGAASPEAEAALEVAEAAGVCSYTQTFEAARQFLRDRTRLHALVCDALGEREGRSEGKLIAFEDILALRLQLVDEGHTAAVVRVTVELAGRASLAIALLVARDLGAAASRLGAQASDLRVWHRLAPARATAVLGDGTGRIRWFGQEREVAIVATRWVEGQALRFASCGEEAATRMARQLAITRSALATFAMDGACERTFELEQGNAMVDRGGELVLVGSAARSWWGPLGAWPYRLASATLGASVSEGSLLLAGEAVLAGLSALACRSRGAELASAMLHQARSEELGRRALDGLVSADARAAVIATVRDLLPHARAELAPFLS